MKRARENWKVNIIAISIIIALAGLIFVSNYTGYVTFNNNEDKIIDINQTITKNSVIPIKFNNSISSLKINGELKGNVKIYLLHDGEVSVIFVKDKSTSDFNLTP